MYLFFRQLRVRDVMPATVWASEVTERVRAVSDRPVSLWMGGGGSRPGTLTFSAPIEGIADLTAVEEALAADAGYLELVGRASEFVEDAEIDRIVQVFHGEITGQADVGSFVGNVTAVAQDGKLAAASAFAVHIADIWGGITGLSPVVAMTTMGPMSEFGWFVRYPDAASIDDANAKLMAAPEYVEALDAGAGLFQPGGVQRYARRIA